MKKPIYDIVRGHFPESQFALMQEVRDGAGFNASRSADYMAMGLWPSRGLSLHGIEQKSYRSDWTKELKTPAKADVFFKYCDYWWLLTTEDKVAKIEEIPEQWGWMHITGGKIKIIKEAPKLTPCAIDRNFLACLLKRASAKDGYVRESSIEERIRRAKEAGENDRGSKIKSLEEKLQILQKQISEFRNFTGIEIGQIDNWRQPNMEKIGKAVNVIANGGVEGTLKDLAMIEASAERVLRSIRIHTEHLKELTKEPDD